ncbi:unnamed protein product [Musa acuminata subsp. malaccensis]|uniref:(wild Malaysian banana) hypothetical protein n=1 Tax=Musa acuminata subsp. malaccensis TaxID=214687 RepID=A0A8D7AXM4_MUSAM|nr:unnamed protein product [Musa acuminata subsp. malaccensis]
MERRPSAAPGRRIYDDFVPPHEVFRGKDAETFVLQLPGSHSLSLRPSIFFCIHVDFNREQIKLQIDNYGKLKISGERPLINDRWKRFLKEFYVPDYCNVSEISGKFENGLLRILLPKFVAETSTKDEAAKAPEAAPDPKATTETKADGSKSDTTQKTKSRPDQESDYSINKQPKDERRKESLDASKDVHKVEEKKKGNEDAKLHEEDAETKKKKAMTQEQATAAGHGRMLGDPKKVQRLGSGLYRRMRVMVSGALAIVVFVGVVLYVTYSLKRPMQMDNYESP